MEIITTITAAVIGSTALSSLIQYFVSRHDSRAETIDRIAEDVKELREDIERGRAISARIRILTASDEVIHGVKHSQEWWDQVLDDCSFYERYCGAHPDFKNKKAVHAIEHLNEVYSQVYTENAFI